MFTRLLFQKLGLLFILLFSAGSFAQAAVSSEVYQQELLVQQQRLVVLHQSNALRRLHLQHLQDRLKSFDEKTTKVTPRQLRQLRLDISVTKTDLATVRHEWTHSGQELKNTRARLKKLEDNLREYEVSVGLQKKKATTTNLPRLRTMLGYQKSLFALKEQEYEAISQAATLLVNTLNLENEYLVLLEKAYEQQQQQARTADLLSLSHQVQLEQQRLLNQLGNLNQRAQQAESRGEVASIESRDLSLQIFQLQQEIIFTQLKWNLADLSHRIDVLADFMKQNTSSLRTLSDRNHYVQSLLQDLQNLRSFLYAKTYLVKERKEIDRESFVQDALPERQMQAHQEIFDELLMRYQTHEKLVGALLKRVQEYQSELDKSLENAVSQRRALPGFDIKEWGGLLKNILILPGLALRYFQVIFLRLWNEITQLKLDGGIRLAFFELLVFSFWILGKKYLNDAAQRLRTNAQRTSSRIMFLVAELLRRNLTMLALSMMLLVAFYSVSTSFKSYNLIFYLIVVWFAFRLILGVARLSFLENVSDHEGQDVVLYHRLKWALISGLILAVFTLLAHQLPVTYDYVQNLFDRLWMLFLLVLSWVLWRERHVIPMLLENSFGQSPTYFNRIVRVFCVLLPLIFISNAIVGLLGYMALAWKIGIYQLIFLTVFTAYIFIRGVWGDIMDIAYDASVRYLKNGWLWSEALLKPVDRVMRIVLVVFAFFFLFYAYGFGEENGVVWNKFSQVLHYQLFSFIGSQVTPLLIIETLITLAIVYWIARWSREFAFRYLFVNVVDKGLRHSLSIFTQYTTVLVGILVTLQVLGIDASALGVILGGLAVGIGFGLRDLANNLVSGILLLIERPLQVGDLVSIGAYEGEVMHVGMRSLVLRTWDHMEAFVPNSEIFSKSFTNWTKQDDIIRITFPMKFAREEDPAFVQELIYRALENTPEVLREPTPEVFLKEIGEAVLEIEVRCYIRIDVQHSRPMLRSRVLFSIVKVLNEAGIQLPYAPHEVFIHSQENFSKPSKFLE